ncbi:MAG: OmpA family protein, partial [Bradymonadaceae bacterium]
LTACSSAPKPKELTELERILNEPGANKVKDVRGALKYYEKSRKLREAALDAHEDGNIELARHLAIRGKIAYRTAEAVKRQLEAKARFEKANAKVQKVNPKIQTLAEQRNKLRKEVQDLHKKVRKAQQQKAAQRRKELEAKSNTSKSEEQELEAQNQIERALEAKQSALELKANDYAKATFNRADNELKSAQSLLDSSPGSADQAAQSAESAKELFEKAAREAKPKYEEEKAKGNPMQRLASLKEKLTMNFGDSRIDSVGRGVKVVVPSLFGPDEVAPRSAKHGDLDTIADLAQKFDEFKITLGGFTRKGDPTENLSVSQVRAKRVRDYLKQQGVKESRMSTEGHGQSQLRYSEAPAKNDRVEVTFRLPN